MPQLSEINIYKSFGDTLFSPGFVGTIFSKISGSGYYRIRM